MAWQRTINSLMCEVSSNVPRRLFKIAYACHCIIKQQQYSFHKSKQVDNLIVKTGWRKLKSSLYMVSNNVKYMKCVVNGLNYANPPMPLNTISLYLNALLSVYLSIVSMHSQTRTSVWSGTCASMDCVSMKMAASNASVNLDSCWPPVDACV